MGRLGDRRLATETGDGPDFMPKPDIAGRLREALGVLEAIEHGELFAAAPANRMDQKRHDAGVAAIAMVSRDLERLLAEVRAYEDLSPQRAA